MTNDVTQLLRETVEFMLDDDPDLVKQTLVPDLLELKLKYLVIRDNTKQAVPIEELTIGECLTASELVGEQAVQLYRQVKSQALNLILQKTPDQAFFGDKQ